MTKTKIDEVKEILARRIEEGAYAPGQRLPSERELAEEMKTSRPTIRAALLRLQSENKVDIVPRSGVYVRFSTTKVTVGSASPQLFLAGAGKRSADRIHADPRIPGTLHLHALFRTAVAAVRRQGYREKLNIGPEEEVWHCHGVLHVASQVPFRVFDSYYPASLLEGWRKEDDEDFIPSPLAPRKKGNAPGPGGRTVERPHADRRGGGRPPHREKSPVLEMDRWVWAKDGKKKEILYEYSRIVFNASLHQFVYEYPLWESDG